MTDDEKIRRTAARLGQLQAKNALRDLRSAARSRAQARREQEQRRRTLGAVVVSAGLGEWHDDEVFGLLIAGREHFGTSSTTRMLLRERALQARVDAVGTTPSGDRARTVTGRRPH